MQHKNNNNNNIQLQNIKKEENEENNISPVVHKFFNEISKEFYIDLESKDISNLSNRFIKHLHRYLSGYKTSDMISSKDLIHVNNIIESQNSSQIIVLKNIEYFTYCSDSFAPIYGQIHIGYIPKSFVATIGALNRVVDNFTKRLQIQEKMLKDISDYLIEKLDPTGIIILCSAKHGCASHEKSFSLSNCHKSGVFCVEHEKVSEFFSVLSI